MSAKTCAAAGALVGLGAGSVLGGEDGAAAGLILGAGAALGVGDLGLSGAEIGELAEELAVGDALLLLVIENVWASGLADAIREAASQEPTTTMARAPTRASPTAPAVHRLVFATWPAAGRLIARWSSVLTDVASPTSRKTTRDRS